MNIRTEKPARGAGWLVLLGLTVGCGVAPEEDSVSRTSVPAAPLTGPRVRVLGTAQDGGLPHAACHCDRCERARRDPRFARRVAALAILLDDEAYLIDATPDIREQLDALVDVRRPTSGRVDRAPVDGVFLSHAHLGHYTGLAFFGFEAVHTRNLPVHATPAMAGYLRANGPWNQLVEIGNIRLVESDPSRPVELGQGVSVTSLRVPHRDEYADTVGYVVRGPRSSVLYVPDTDGWSVWSRPIGEWAAEVDVALLDGSFYSLDELPGRDVASVGHPLIVDSMELLEPFADRQRPRVWFTHFNHSNPALDPSSPEHARIEERGFGVLEDGMEFPL